MTCTSLASVTVSPPVLLVSLEMHSGTLAALLTTETFTVNLLHVRARHTAEIFASAAADRFARTAWRPSRRLGVPWLADDSFAMAECLLADTLAVGDHVIVLGGVVGTYYAHDTPLMYGLRQFSCWPQPPGSRIGAGTHPASVADRRYPIDNRRPDDRRTEHGTTEWVARDDD